MTSICSWSHPSAQDALCGRGRGECGRAPQRLRLSPAGFRKRALQAWAAQHLRAGTLVRSNGPACSGACRRLAAHTKRGTPREPYIVASQPLAGPGVYFWLLLLGYLMGIDSERGIALTVSDSLGRRRFLGYELQQSPPDHSTLSRTRRRISLETHEQVFAWVLQRLRKAGLADGRTVAVDATMLFSNAALRTLRRKDSQAGYREFVEGLAAAAGVPMPTLAEGRL